MDSIFTIHLLILQGNLIGRAVVEYCEGGPQVGEKSLKQDFTELHANWYASDKDDFRFYLLLEVEVRSFLV